MPKTVRLDVITAERSVYSDDVSMVIARATDGDIGVLPNHVPLIAGLVPFPVRIKKEDAAEEKIFVSGGFLEVQPDKVSILATAAELATEIDLERAQSALERAKKRLAEREEGIDLERAERALLRASVRIMVAARGR